MARSGRIQDYTSDELIINTFVTKACNKTETAKTLGMSYAALTLRLDTPDMIERVQEAREGLIDLAETNLIKLIRKGNLNALKYFLDAQGRRRGYGKQLEGMPQNSNAMVTVIGDDMTIEQAAIAYADTLVDTGQNTEGL